MDRGVWRDIVKVKSLSRVRLFVTPWTVAYQAPPSMGFSRQECWSGLPFPSPGDLPNPGIEPRSPALQADTLPSEPPGMGFSKSNAKRELYSNTSLPQETRETPKNLTLHLKQLEKEVMKNPKVSRRKEIIKIRAEISGKKKRYYSENQQKSWFFKKINKIDKPLARLIKKKKGAESNHQIRNENGEFKQTTQKYKGS